MLIDEKFHWFFRLPFLILLANLNWSNLIRLKYNSLIDINRIRRFGFYSLRDRETCNHPVYASVSILREMKIEIKAIAFDKNFVANRSLVNKMQSTLLDERIVSDQRSAQRTIQSRSLQPTFFHDFLRY